MQFSKQPLRFINCRSIGTFQTNASGGYKIELVPPKLKLVKKIEWISFFHKNLKHAEKLVHDQKIAPPQEAKKLLTSKLGL